MDDELERALASVLERIERGAEAGPSWVQRRFPLLATEIERALEIQGLRRARRGAESPAHPRRAPRIFLCVESGVCAGEEFELEEHEVLIFGRAPGCDARLGADTYASRHHFVLEVSGGRAIVRDLGSRNGTYVNKQKLSAGGAPKSSRRAGAPAGELELTDGDVVRAGRTSVRLRVERPAGTSAPTEEFVPPTSCAVISIGGYSIEHELGRGSFGVTYLGRDHARGGTAAIKVLFARTDAVDTARKRFLREVVVMRGVRHPNVVSLIDGGEDGEYLFLAMEHCDGGSAMRLLDGRPRGLAVEELRDVMLGAAQGLAHVHERGLVHRDIKPHNVLLATRGKATVAKLADFGLAKAFESAGLSGLTLSGAAGGTLDYMPREQLLAFKHVRPVSDVWALGATFYHLLCGVPPRDEHGAEPLQTVLEGAVIPIRERRADVSARLALVLERALAIEPADRYKDGAALAEALEIAL